MTDATPHPNLRRGGRENYAKYGPSCPNCNEAASRVKDTRQTTDGTNPALFVKRRRECISCGHRFTTYETTKVEAQLSPALRYNLRQAMQEISRLLKVDQP